MPRASLIIDRVASEGRCVFLNNCTVTKEGLNAGKTVPVSQAYKDANLYRRLVNDWSMRDSEVLNVSGHDHFFATFADFGGAAAIPAPWWLSFVAGRPGRMCSTWS